MIIQARLKDGTIGAIESDTGEEVGKSWMGMGFVPMRGCPPKVDKPWGLIVYDREKFESFYPVPSERPQVAKYL